MYNLTFIDNSTNIYDITLGMNSITPVSLFANFILFAIFIIAFAAMARQDTKVAFLLASFITSIVAILSFFLNFISMTNLSIPIILFFAALITKAFTDQ